MSQNFSDSDYGPLAGLIGTWKGTFGVDHSPEPDGEDVAEFTDEICFTPALLTSNAEEQNIMALHYQQKVVRNRDGKIFHQQTGYWMWQVDSDHLMFSLCIPRGLAGVAEGKLHYPKAGTLCFDYEAKAGLTDFGLVQSPFLQAKAKTKSFAAQFKLQGNELSYTQQMELDIYGRDYHHHDESRLTRCS